MTGDYEWANTGYKCPCCRRDGPCATDKHHTDTSSTSSSKACHGKLLFSFFTKHIKLPSKCIFSFNILPPQFSSDFLPETGFIILQVPSVGGDKTWSSVMVGGESGGGTAGGLPNTVGGSGPSFLAHQSPQFQAEFPSLPGEGGAPGPPSSGGRAAGGGPGAGAGGGEGGYGPGPSLRPQTEGSWVQGGGYAQQQGSSQPPSQQQAISQQPQPPHQPQSRPVSQFPPQPSPLSSTSNIIPQYKGVVPPFVSVSYFIKDYTLH